MTGLPEHVERARHHGQPRPTTHWNKDEADQATHPGPVRDDCPLCKPAPSCWECGAPGATWCARCVRAEQTRGDD